MADFKPKPSDKRFLENQIFEALIRNDYKAAKRLRKTMGLRCT